MYRVRDIRKQTSRRNQPCSAGTRPQGLHRYCRSRPIPWQEIKAKAYSVFHLSGSYQLTDSLTLRAGVENLFDTEPSLTGATYDVSLSEYTHRCDGAVAGCQNPTGP